MQIQRRPGAPRELGEERRFDYQFDYFRVVVTHVPPGHVQNMHSHRELYDCTYMIVGELVASERRDGKTTEERLRAGDIVAFEPGYDHTVANDGGETAITLTLKLRQPDGLTPEAFAALCMSDWQAAT